MVRADSPKRPLASRCNDVRSNSSGLAWVVGFGVYQGGRLLGFG